MVKERGIALVPTLMVSLVTLLFGFSAMYISEMAYRSISAEARWQILEKAATSEIKKFGLDLVTGKKSCSDSNEYKLNSVNVEVRSISAGGSCFIWLSTTLRDSRVTKVGLIPLTQSVPTDYGAAVFKSLTNFTLGGSGAFASCDSSCSVPSIITGKGPQNPPSGTRVTTCPNNPKGIVALVDPPYQVNRNLSDMDLTSVVFKNLQNRNDMLNTFTRVFNVNFSNGKPEGVNNPECRPDFNINNCIASGSRLTCECSGSSCRVDLTWNSSIGKYTGRIGSSTGVSCGSIDLGQNSTVAISGFTGGGIIGANQINFSGNINNTSNPPTLTLIARNQITDGSNNINIKNVNMFSQNYTLDNNNLQIEGGVIYSGGAGNGNININLNSNSSLGSTNNPVLIVSDNNINLGRNGNAEINGLIFATSSNNNFNLGSGNGNFSINGAIFSNSTNNNVNVSGNFSVNFSKTIIENLANKYQEFINPPKCGSQNTQSTSASLIQTLITVY
ncbi:MAG: hypothetical protein N2Z80_02045 [Hydrogenothermaceae bacterium]|nr:hypothetical protein [Hydrogenothermaceae bacterium]